MDNVLSFVPRLGAIGKALEAPILQDRAHSGTPGPSGPRASQPGGSTEPRIAPITGRD